MPWFINQIVEWIGDAVVGLLNILISLATDGLGLSGETTLDVFFKTFPFCGDMYELSVYVGLFILYTITTFQLFKALFGPIVEAESPGILALRTAMYSGVILASYQICSIIIWFGTEVYQFIETHDMATVKANLSVADATKLQIEGGAGMLAVTAPGMIIMLLFIILIIRILTNFFNLILEVIERYVILGFLTIVAPMCLATGASKATSNICRSFIRMYISQVVVMCMSILFMKVFAHAMGQWVADLAHEDAVNPVTGLLMILAWLKLGQRVDQHMATLGLSVAQAGGLGQEMAFAAAAAADGRGITGKAANGITNAIHGTTFGQKGSPRSALDALSQGMMGKKAARMQAASPDGPKTNSRLSQHVAKKANEQGKTMPLKDMLDKKSGSVAQGAFIGNSMQKELGLPDGWQATNKSHIDKDGNMIGHFKDENGVEHTVAFKQGEDPNALATVTGKNGETYSVMGADSNGTIDAITGGNLTPNNMAMEEAQAGIKSVNDQDGNQIEGAAGVAQNENGDIVATNEDGEIMKDDDGNEILAGSVETDDGRTIDMDDSIMIGEDGEIYQADDRGDLAMVAGGGMIADEDGEFAMANNGTALSADEDGDRALASAGAEMYEHMDGQAGDMFYDENGGGFKNSEDYFNDDGTAKEDEIESRDGNSVTFKDGTKASLDKDGKLSDSFSQLAMTSDDYGKGMELQKTESGAIATFNAKGEADANGAYVKTTDDKMIAKDDLIQNAEGGIQTFAAKSVGEGGTEGFQSLQRDANGSISTFDAQGRQDANGAFVKTTTGELMARSSFATGADGGVAGFSARPSESNIQNNSMEKLETNPDGSFKTFNAHGAEDKNGSFYKRVNGDDTSSLVTKNSYRSSDTGNADSYSSSMSGLSAGNFVKDVDTGEFMQINRQGAAAGSAPKRMDAYGAPDASGSYVSAINSQGQQVLAHVGTDQNGAIQTYNMQAQTATISSVDGTKASVSTVGYTNSGNSIGAASVPLSNEGNCSSGYYCKSDSGNKYNEISSNGGFTESGAIQTYDRDENGSYVPNSDGTGEFAKTVNPGNAYEENYSRIGNSDIYTPNQVTDAGLPVTGTATDGSPQITLDSSNFQVHSSSNGVVQATIGGNECTLYSERMGYQPASVQDGECAKMSINGESYYVQTHTPGNFTTNPSYEGSRTYSGDEAQRLMSDHGVNDRIVSTHDGRTTSDPKYDTVQTTNQGMICYDSQSARTERQDDKGNTYWVQEASYVTPHRPAEDSSFETLKDPTTGNDMYKMQIEARFSQPQGGVGKIAVTKQIYDKNSHNKKSRSKFRNTKLGKFRGGR